MTNANRFGRYFNLCWVLGIVEHTISVLENQLIIEECLYMSLDEGGSRSKLEGVSGFCGGIRVW
jgi:hypothetical protein